jgi:hypothetical protein
VYFSGENGGITCLEGNVDKGYSDNEIKEMLKGYVFLASDVAENLIKRGFGDYIGVEVKERSGKTPTGEIFCSTNKKCSVQANVKEIVPIKEDVVGISWVYHSIGGINPERLFHGIVSYKNELGGTVYTFCGTPKAPFSLGAIFSFLNHTRKTEIINMVKATGQLTVYYPGDEEVYLKAGKIKDNKLLCAMLNVGYDKIENIELVIQGDVKNIEYLDNNGQLNTVDFEVKDGNFVIGLECNVLEPIIFIISFN